MNKEEAIVILYTLKNGTATTYYMDNFVKCDEAIDVVLNLIQKHDKIIDAMKYRVVLTEKEHRMILKMLEKRFNKRYEDCVVEYFKKVVDEDAKD